MEGLSGKQSSVPEDEMERGWGEEIQTSVAGEGGRGKAKERWLPHFYPKAAITVKQAILLFLNDEWIYYG